MKLSAPVLQPLRAFSLRNVPAILLRFDNTVDTEVTVGLEFVLEVLTGDIDHKGIVQVAQSGNFVRYQIVDFREISQRFEYLGTVLGRYFPVGVREQTDKGFKSSDTLLDVLRCIRLPDFTDRFPSVIDDCFVIQVALAL